MHDMQNHADYYLDSIHIIFFHLTCIWVFHSDFILMDCPSLLPVVKRSPSLPEDHVMAATSCCSTGKVAICPGVTRVTITARGRLSLQTPPCATVVRFSIHRRNPSTSASPLWPVAPSDTSPRPPCGQKTLCLTGTQPGHSWACPGSNRPRGATS